MDAFVNKGYILSWQNAFVSQPELSLTPSYEITYTYENPYCQHCRLPNCELNVTVSSRFRRASDTVHLACCCEYRPLSNPCRAAITKCLSVWLAVVPSFVKLPSFMQVRQEILKFVPTRWTSHIIFAR